MLGGATRPLQWKYYTVFFMQFPILFHSTGIIPMALYVDGVVESGQIASSLQGLSYLSIVLGSLGYG